MLISELQNKLEGIKTRLGDLPVYAFLGEDEEVTEVEPLNEQALRAEVRGDVVAVRLS